MKKILCIALAAAMALGMTSCKKKDDDSSAEPAAVPTNITVAAVSLGTIMNSVTNSGEVVPGEEVAVSAKLSGKAVSSNVTVGKYVNAGDVLFAIEDTDYRLQVNQAKAALDSAQAGYNSTVGGTQKQSVQQVEQALTSAKLALENAQQNYDRQKQLNENNSSVILAQTSYNDAKDAYDRTKSLFDMGAATQVSLDAAHSAMQQAEENLKTVQVNANASLEAAESSLKNAQEALATAQQNYDLTINVLNPERQQTASASVQSAKAAYDLAANSLSNTTVRAPISGYVTSTNVTVGEMVQAGSPMVTIIDTHSMDIKLKVTESVVTGITAGSSAQISVKSAGIENISGSVATVSPSKDSVTGLFEVTINVPNSDGILKGGMFADVMIVTEKYDDMLCIPSKAVITENDKSYVYVENGGNAVKKEVTLGKSDEENTQVLSGVSEGENVVVKGKEYITESNTAVNVVTE